MDLIRRRTNNRVVERRGYLDDRKIPQYSVMTDAQLESMKIRTAVEFMKELVDKCNTLVKIKNHFERIVKDNRYVYTMPAQAKKKYFEIRLRELRPVLRKQRDMLEYLIRHFFEEWDVADNNFYYPGI